MTRIILDEHDADRLLRILYNGTRPKRIHTLVCLCGAIADLRVSPCAWNGWQILPHAMCPHCKSMERARLVYAPWSVAAREQFLRSLEGGETNKRADP